MRADPVAPRAGPPDAAGARVGRGWTLRFGLLWLGLWAAQLAPVQLLLPVLLADVDPAHRVRDLGLVNGLAGLAALAALPLFGRWCDRTRSRFGRRRVWVAAGVVVDALGLVLLAGATTWPAVAGAWLVAQLGLYAAMTGLTAVIADQVPAGQRATVSAAVFAPQALGIVVGLGAVAAVDARPGPGALVLVVLLLVTAVPWLLRSRDTLPLPDVPTVARVRTPATGDQRWAFAGRLLVNLGNALGTTYLLYFLADGLGVADPEGALLTVTLVYLVTTVAATWLGGRLSDATGRRRAPVAAAAGLQALACALLVVAPSWTSVLVAGALLGAGYGAFTSVDQALVTEVLPDPDALAADLGVLNVALVAPQALAPLLAALVISSLGGYPVLFAVAGVTTVLGALSVSRIRSVR